MSKQAKKILVVTAALALGAGTAQAQDWAGFYAGVNAGYGTGNIYDGTVPGLAAMFADPNGLLGGAQIGANVQFDNVVLGVEADFQKSNVSGADLCPCGTAFGTDEFGTIRARAGVAFDNVLAYATGGIAFGRGVLDLGMGGQVVNSHTGWAGGVGVEAMVHDSVSLKGEYLYVDLAPQNYGGIDAGLRFHTFRAGVNFHF